MHNCSQFYLICGGNKWIVGKCKNAVVNITKLSLSLLLHYDQIEFKLIDKPGLINLRKDESMRPASLMRLAERGRNEPWQSQRLAPKGGLEFLDLKLISKYLRFAS